MEKKKEKIMNLPLINSANTYLLEKKIIIIIKLNLPRDWGREDTSIRPDQGNMYGTSSSPQVPGEPHSRLDELQYCIFHSRASHLCLRSPHPCKHSIFLFIIIIGKNVDFAFARILFFFNLSF